MKHTQETLQQLSEEELTRICAEVCCDYNSGDAGVEIFLSTFQPLTNTGVID